MRLRDPAPRSTGALPPELADREHAFWSDRGAYLAFMADRGWRLPSMERMGADPGPAHRRRAAVEGWAHEQGIVREGHPGFLDWHRLRAMGLV